jgi:hypothetical protein
MLNSVFIRNVTYVKDHHLAYLFTDKKIKLQNERKYYGHITLILRLFFSCFKILRSECFSFFNVGFR